MARGARYWAEAPVGVESRNLQRLLYLRFTVHGSALEVPFQKKIIKTRRGSRGDQLSYAPVSAYVECLNLVFESNWTWCILGHEIHCSEVVVRGALTAAGVEK
jgi:hypothetical protein